MHTDMHTTRQKISAASKKKNMTIAAFGRLLNLHKTEQKHIEQNFNLFKFKFKLIKYLNKNSTVHIKKKRKKKDKALPSQMQQSNYP